MTRPALAAAALLAALAAPAAAHDGAHPAPATAEAAAPPPLPFEIRPRFALLDGSGARRTPADYAGRPYAVTFGYGACEGMCPLTFSRLAEACAILAARGHALPALAISVDPARDTPAAFAAAVAARAPGLTALTGSASALAQARAAFGVEARPVSATPAGAPILSHGSLIYLIGPQGRALTFAPPILPPKALADLLERYL